MAKRKCFKVDAKELIMSLGMMDANGNPLPDIKQILEHKQWNKTANISEDGRRMIQLLNRYQHGNGILVLDPSHLAEGEKIPVATLLNSDLGLNFDNKQAEEKQIDFTPYTPSADEVSVDVNIPKLKEAAKDETKAEEAEEKANPEGCITKDTLKEILRRYDQDKGWLRKLKFSGRDSDSKTVKALKVLMKDSKKHIFKHDVIKILEKVDREGSRSRSSNKTKIPSYAGHVKGEQKHPVGKNLSATDNVVDTLRHQFAAAERNASKAAKDVGPARPRM